MLNNRYFWMSQIALASAAYLAALGLALTGQPSHWLIKLAAILLIAHLFEIPLAMRLLKKRDPSLPRLFVLTLFFGLLWFIPARRGLFEVR